MVPIPPMVPSSILQMLQQKAVNQTNPANTAQTNGSAPSPAIDDSTLSPEAQQAQLIAQLLQAQNAGKATNTFWNNLAKLYQKSDVPGVSVLPGATASKDQNGSITVSGGPGGPSVSFEAGAPQHQALAVPTGTKGAVGNGAYQFANGKQLTVSGLTEGQGMLFSVPVTPVEGAASGAPAGGTAAPSTPMGMNYTPQD